MSHMQIQSARREPSDAVREMPAIAIAPMRLHLFAFRLSNGVFPDAVMAQPLWAILDTDWLGFDVDHACACNQRTALVTAANQQHLRPFCAQHVADEIVEHVETWS